MSLKELIQKLSDTEDNDGENMLHVMTENVKGVKAACDEYGMYFYHYKEVGMKGSSFHKAVEKSLVKTNLRTYVGGSNDEYEYVVAIPKEILSEFESKAKKYLETKVWEG